jgi:hypothetical protein
MAVLDEMVVAVPDETISDVTVDQIKLSIARQLWGWYEKHKDDVLVKRKLLWISVSIHVRDLRGLFVHLLGEPV